jgi:hypothetical protein
MDQSGHNGNVRRHPSIDGPVGADGGKDHYHKGGFNDGARKSALQRVDLQLLIHILTNVRKNGKNPKILSLKAQKTGHFATMQPNQPMFYDRNTKEILTFAIHLN